MQVDTKTELKRILDFLQVPYSRQHLEVVVQEGYSQYRRQEAIQFEHYTQSQKAYVKEIVRSTLDTIRGSNYEEYLTSA